jgi:hypothetical protein
MNLSRRYMQESVIAVGILPFVIKALKNRYAVSPPIEATTLILYLSGSRSLQESTQLEGHSESAGAR